MPVCVWHFSLCLVAEKFRAVKEVENLLHAFYYCFEYAK
jgi:hypothetical protein